MAGLTQKIYRTLRKVKCDLRRDVSCFTPALAVAHALCGLPLRGPVFQPVGRWAAKRRDAAIFDYLDQNYGAFFETFARQWTPPEKKECSGPAPIWVCWLQGEEQAPKLVRRCIASIRKNANGHPVNLLTEENIGRYLSIPRGILQKYRHGAIGQAHFADIARMMLLKDYGGLWLDATILCTKPVPDWYFQRSFFSCKGAVREGGYISRYRWTSFVLGGMPEAYFYSLMTAFYLEYWKRENAAIDYLFMDYVIDAAYKRFPILRDEIDKLPENNLRRDDLAACMNEPFIQEKWDALMASDTVLFKLSWRENYAEHTPTGEPTFYQYFLTEEKA